MSQMRSIIDQLLTNASRMYVPKGYISEVLFPYLPVVQYTGKIAAYAKDHLRVETSLAGGQGMYRRVQPIIRSQDSYEIEPHGLEGIVTKQDYANVLKPYDAEEDLVIGLSSHLWLEKEQVLATALSATGTLTQNTTLSGNSQLSDYTNSDPISVFSTARAAVKNGCGVWPNKAWMDSRTADKLRFHPQLLDFLGFKDNRPGGLSDMELSKALNVNQVLIADADYNSAVEGQTASLAACWGKHVWFGVMPDRAGLREVTGGYRLGIAGASPRKVYKYAINNPPEAVGILVEDEYDFVLADVTAMYLIKDAIA